RAVKSTAPPNTAATGAVRLHPTSRAALRADTSNRLQQAAFFGDTGRMAIRIGRDLAVQSHLQDGNAPAQVELLLFHDVLCSWCYLADAGLEVLREEYGPSVRWSFKPYALRPENQLPDKKQRSLLARHFRRISKEREGKGVKADLWTGEDPPSSSLPPLVALEAALPQGSEKQHQLLLRMRRAAFMDGINVARRDVQLE